jgi:NAD(P)-dependent dehydrogenase (short-subunit alcohol dehydrogenase family)
MKKIALVTAGNKGIGQGIVLRLAKEGYKVYASARSIDKIEETMGLCKDYDVEPIIFDVRDYDDLMGKIRALGHLDAVVNAAGLSIVKKTIEELDITDWTEILDTNVMGYFFVIKAAIENMEAGGAIVNITSGAAKTGGNFVSIPYSSSKGAINSLTISVARDLAPRGIRVNAVSPGFVASDMLKLNGKPFDYYPDIIPLHRLGKPEDIANMVYYLVSDESNFMTGQIIEVNGGDIMG